MAKDKNKKNKKFLFIIFLVLVIWLFGYLVIPSAFVQGLEFKPSIGLPGEPKFARNAAVPIGPRTVGEYISALYSFSIGAIAVIAVVMIIVGGLQWVAAAGSPNLIASAKKRISNALIGLILALSAYLILYTINPALVIFKPLEVPGVPTKPPKEGATTRCEWAIRWGWEGGEHPKKCEPKFGPGWELAGSEHCVKEKPTPQPIGWGMRVIEYMCCCSTGCRRYAEKCTVGGGLFMYPQGDCCDGLICNKAQKRCLPKLDLSAICREHLECKEGLVCSSYNNRCMTGKKFSPCKKDEDCDQKQNFSCLITGHEVRVCGRTGDRVFPCLDDKDCKHGLTKCVRGEKDQVGFCTDGSRGAVCRDDEDCHVGSCNERSKVCED